MKKVVMGVMVAVMAVSIGLSSAEAKRMGSGGSVGKQSQSVNQSGSAQSAQSPAAMQSAAPARPGGLTSPRSYAPGEVSLKKGEEMGRFLLGSTVVLLFPENTLGFHGEWEASRPVRLGEALGHPRMGKTHVSFGLPDNQAG